MDPIVSLNIAYISVRMHVSNPSNSKPFYLAVRPKARNNTISRADVLGQSSKHSSSAPKADSLRIAL